MLDYGNKSIEEERTFRKNQLAAAFRIFSKFGFDNGVTGHITVRDPEFTDSYWVNPYMKHFSQIKSSDLVRVNEAGEVVEGDSVVNKAALVIHSAVHNARPDAVAAAHAHTTYGQIWSTTGKKIKPLTQDSCAFYNDLTLFEDYTGVVYEGEEGERIAQALGNKKASILRNHGLLTVGSSVAEAAWWFILLERSCREHVYAHMLGEDPIEITPEVAASTYKDEGSIQSGREQFQPLWEMIVKEQPDLLE